MTISDQIEAVGVVSLREGLRLLRRWCEEVGDYHPARPVVHLATGGYLQPQLRQAADGSELAGCWRIERRDPHGQVRRRYPAG